MDLFNPIMTGQALFSFGIGKKGGFGRRGMSLEEPETRSDQEQQEKRN